MRIEQYQETCVGTNENNPGIDRKPAGIQPLHALFLGTTMLATAGFMDRAFAQSTVEDPKKGAIRRWAAISAPSVLMPTAKNSASNGSANPRAGLDRSAVTAMNLPSRTGNSASPGWRFAVRDD